MEDFKLVEQKDELGLIDFLMEYGRGKDDKGLQSIADETGHSFSQIKNYIQSF